MQLRRLVPAFAGARVTWLTTEADYAHEVQEQLFLVRDANLWNKWALVLMFLEVAWAVVRIRPDVVVTTGAAPGFAAVLCAKLVGARSVWIDSIANSETMSKSGAKVGRWADVWLIQWEHLARPEGPRFWGAVL